MKNKHIKKLVVAFYVGLNSTFAFANPRDAGAAANPPARELRLTVGQSIQIPLPTPAEAIRLRGKKIIRVEDQKDHLLVRGIAPGQAQISVGQQTHSVIVSHNNSANFYKQVQVILNDKIGLKAEHNGQHVIITGQLHRLSDWQDLTRLAETYNAHYLFKARLDEDIQTSANDWLHTRFTQHQLPAPKILWQPAVKVIVATAHSEQTYLWQNAIAATGAELQFEKSEIALEPLVRVQIVVAELSRQMQMQLGIDWPTDMQAQLAPKFNGSQPLSVLLKAVEQKGLGQILASPNLLARSGSEAEFLAGGEFPIKIVTAHRREVVWKRHGILLKIKPRADRTGRMSIELNTEVSLLDHGQAVEGIPSLKTNRTSTHFDLSSAQTIILSGLIRHDWGNSQGGIAGLASIPILGKLFGSHSFQNQKSELVIFVTPEIITERQSAEKTQTEKQPNQNLYPGGWRHDINTN